MDGSEIVQEAISRGDWDAVARLSSTIAAKGARYTDKNGYVHVLQQSGSYLLDYRIVMEEKLGRPLRKHEIVHHINGDKSDDSPENLELWIRPHPGGVRASDLICPHCGMPYS